MNNNTLDFILYRITTNHILTIIWIFDMTCSLLFIIMIHYSSHYYHSFILLSLTLSVNITNIITDIEIMVHKV